MAQAPINYGLPGVNVGMQDFAGGLQVGQNIGLGLQAAQTAEQGRLIAQQQQMAAREAAMRKAAEEQAEAQRAAEWRAELAREANREGGPTTAGILRLMTLNPKEAENLRRGFDALAPQEQEVRKGQMLRGDAAITAGKPDVAVQYFLEEADKYEAGGRKGDAEALRRVAKSVQENPAQAGTVLKAQLASIMGPEYAKATTEFMTQESAAKKAEAEARIKTAEADDTPARLVREGKLTDQQAARYKAQTAIEWARLAFDKDKAKFEREAAEEVRRLGRLNPEVAKDLTASSAAIAGAAAQLRAVRSLRARLKEVGGGFGALSKGADWLAEATGSEGEAQAFRKQFAAFTASDLVKNLPPGVASDKDIELIQRGLPSEYGSEQLMDEYLAAVERVNQEAIAFGRARAAYLNRNGDLGAARETMQIGDLVIPAGTSFIDAMLERADKKERVDTGTTTKARGLNSKFGGQRG